MPEITAIEIKHPKTYEIIKALDPSYDLPYDDVHLNFLVIGYPEPGTIVLMTPETVAEHFDHIENGLQITLKQLVK